MANLKEPCYCRVFHSDCDASACQQAVHATKEHAPPVSLRAFKARAKEGCKTCDIVANALSIPEIRSSWRSLIGPALESKRWGFIQELSEDEEAIHVELDPPHTVNDRRVVRVRASNTSADWMNFNVWSETTPASDACKSFKALKHHPDSRTDSQKCLDNLKLWITSCDRDHPCLKSSNPPLPTRVIQVKENSLKIVAARGTKGRYLTLSHRWGNDEPLKLTTANSEEMHREIQWDKTPRLFQDAIWLTRQLGVDYIWIDNLCIIQDDIEDWERESTQMKEVYGGSFLNIAASHCTSSADSLFSTSSYAPKYPACTVSQNPGLLIREQPSFKHFDFGSNYLGFRKTRPLLSRAWVLQERLLSPRVAYFDADELLWECSKTADCQCGGIVSMWNFKVDHSSSISPGGTPLPLEWMRISEVYSGCGLTKQHDRMRALQGIASKALASGRGGRYLAGLWEHNLAHQLCWEIQNTHHKPKQYMAPSWSWLSIFGNIWNFNRMDYGADDANLAVQIKEVEVTPAKELDPTGPVVAGYLKVTGPCVDVNLLLEGAGSSTKPPTYACLKKTGRMWNGVSIQADYVMAEVEANSITRGLLVFWGHMWPERSAFLLLRPVAGEDETYERLGIVFFEEEEENDKAQLEIIRGWCGSQRTVVIV